MNMAYMDISLVRRGDVVRFKSYALQVAAEPKREGNFVVLHGRISTDGCPLVTRKYLPPLLVTVERG
jgi:hypothetical protein